MIELKYLATRSGKALVLSVDSRKYLLNLFEGFQRYCIELGVSINKIAAVFLASEESIPPLVGTYLTMRDMKKESLGVVCCPQLQEVVESASRFADPMGMRICYTRSYSDEFVRVDSVPNRVVCSGAARSESCFVLDIRPIRGRFLVGKVPKEVPKHLYSRLTRRERVEHGGRTYSGEEYMEDDIDIGTIAVVYSSGNYAGVVERLRAQAPRHFFCFQREAMQFLASSLEGRFYLLEDNCFVEYGSLYTIQTALNSIDTDFLLPLAPPGPRGPLPRSVECVQSGDALVYSKDSRSFSHIAATHREHRSCTREYKQRSILFLGTGCAIPSKYRNVSAILYESSDSAIMLDCGEDALFQIHRAYGDLNVLRKLKAVFISHSHADHVLGIVSVLRRTERGIKVFGPAAVRPFLERFGMRDHEYIETNHAKTLERAFRAGGGQRTSKDAEDYLLRFDVGLEIAICGVDHCSDSCGIRVKDGDTVLAYSGDSRPSVLFGMMSSGSDVMIHEATFTSDQSERAMHTGHSTVDGAVEVFRASGSKALLLTHFSQRYSKGMLSDGEWIPCVDLFRYAIGSTEYPAEEVNSYYCSLGVDEGE